MRVDPSVEDAAVEAFIAGPLMSAGRLPRRVLCEGAVGLGGLPGWVLARRLAERAEGVLMVDGNPKAVACARQLADQTYQAALIQSDPGFPWVPEASLEAVLSLGCLERLDERAFEAWLAGVWRVLRPGGVVYAHAPIRWRGLKEPERAQAGPAPKHLRSIPQTQALLRQSGFGPLAVVRLDQLCQLPEPWSEEHLLVFVKPESGPSQSDPASP